MSERINLAEIEARMFYAQNHWGNPAVTLVHDDLPALIAWVRGAREALLLLRGTGPIGDAKRGECRSCEVRWSAGLTEMADNRSHEAHQPNCPWKVCAALLSLLEEKP